ncbi:unnamed protein product, partial [Rotaria socialis]
EQQIAAHLHMTATVAFNNDTNWYENKNEWIKVRLIIILFLFKTKNVNYFIKYLSLELF